MRLLILTLILSVAPASAASAQSRNAPKTLVAKGDILMARNKVDAAIETYTKAIESNPAYAEAYVKRGLARRASGDLAGSIEDYEKASSIDPRATRNNRFVAESYSNRGYNKLNEMDVDGAIADFTRAADISPAEADHYYKRGHARLIKEEFDGAVADFDKALGLADKWNTFLRTLIHANRGMARHLQGREQEARKDFDECIRLNKGDKLMLEGHLLDIEMRIQILKRMRAERLKGIARAGGRENPAPPSPTPASSLLLRQPPFDEFEHVRL
ncbi:MAG TPA: tetratricopeptide repeat protein [Pyrinomonadaceae bacterium]|jgi:tetratricopeptide (TPR) repeat protein|nr:tetratricopeptide repeat protein [Pyrinomonadaceae bacterium]